MKRREFIGLIGSTAVIWPLPLRAQESIPVIGYLSGISAGDRIQRSSTQREGERARA